MTTHVYVLAGAVGFLLATVAASLLCLARARSVLGGVPRTLASETALEVLQQKLDALEQEVRGLPRNASEPAEVPAAPRCGFNLEKRSHALRLHRRGEPSSRIAAALELPLQEVELLIKVHRVVLKSI